MVLAGELILMSFTSTMPSAVSAAATVSKSVTGWQTSMLMLCFCDCRGSSTTGNSADPATMRGSSTYPEVSVFIAFAARAGV